MLLEIQYTAQQSVTDAVGSLGRTEDVRFSPSNRRLAVASFSRNRIVVFDIDIASSLGATQVALTGGLELSSPALQWPHGLDFIDDDTLIVTSRGSDVARRARSSRDRAHRHSPWPLWHRPQPRQTRAEVRGEKLQRANGKDRTS